MFSLVRARALLAAAVCLLGASIVLAQVTRPAVPPKSEAQKTAEAKGSHKEETSIKVRSADGKYGLQTLTVDDDGRVLALVAPPRHFSSSAAGATSEVHVFDGAGKKVTSWKVNFHAQAINTDDKGTVYVAGDGKVAKFDRSGKLLGQIDLPHIKDLLKNKDELKKQAEEQIKLQKQSFENSRKQIAQMKEKLEKIAEDKRTALQKRQLQQYAAILKSYESSAKYYDTLKVDTVIQQITSRLRIINSVAISKKDIFIVCGESKGFGYAVWRMDHDFKNARSVMTGLRGCCSQMDVQVHGDDLLVAQNCDHQWGRYDRDGKKIGSWGKRGKETDPECFGGCCNPMNLRAGKNGDVYTAESEGIIKRFSAKGEFLGVVGYAPLTGGCKNVAVGASPDGARVYFADQPGSRIIVLAKKAAAATE
jgi:archaellum component FlaC